MTPGAHDMTMYQGSTFKKILTISGVTLADYSSVRMQIRKKANSTTPIWDSGVSGGLTKTSTQLVLNIPAHLTAGFNFKTAGYDIELVKTSTDPMEVDKILSGTITLEKEFTKDYISA
jgi:hypothetical protein